MALKRKNIPLIFSQGLTSNTVDEVKQFSEVQTVENMFFNQQGMFESCRGFTKLAANSSPSFTSVHNFKDSFIGLSTKKLYSYNTLDKFTEIGDITNFKLKSETLYRSGSNTSSNPAIAKLTTTGVFCIAWYEATVGIQYAIYDTTNNSYIVKPTVVDATGTMVKCVANELTNSFLIVVARPATNLILSYKYNMTTSSLSTSTTMVSNLRATNTAFDVIPYLNGRGATVAYSNTSNFLSMFHITTGNVLGTSSNGYYNQVTTSIQPGKALCIKAIDTDLLLGYNTNSSNAVKTIWYGYDFLALSGEQAIGSLTSSTTANNLTIVNIDDTEAGVFVDEINATYRYGKLFYGQVNRSSITSSLSQKFTGLMIASEAFLDKNSVPAVVGIHKSTEQTKYIIVNSGSKVLGQFSEGIAGDNSVTAQLDTVSQIVTNGEKTYIPLLQRGKLSSETGTFVTISGVILTTLDRDFSPTSVEYADSLYFSGSMPKTYDGTNVTEAGFTLYPENLTLQSELTGAGGTIDVGTYSYKAVFEYYDSQGRLFESKTSPALQYTVTTGGATHSLVVRIPSVLISEKAKVIVALYRTVASGTVYYKVSSTTSPNTITPSTNTFIDITDTLPDSTIRTNQTLYTTGGILENGVFPACTSLKVANGRLWFSGCENQRLVYYSKTSNQFQAAQTATEFYYDTLEGGSVLNIAEFANAIAVFKQRGIYIISGTPAANNKTGSTLQPIRKIAVNVTSINNGVIQELSQGIVFCSDYGVQLLDFSGQVNNLGDAISNKITPSEITAIKYIEHFKHVRVYTTNTCWVYDTELKTWYEWPIHSAISSVIVGSEAVFVKSDGYIRQESDIYSADNAPYTLKVKSGWLSLPNMLYVQRIYSIWPIMRNFSSHNLQVNMYYDFNPQIAETFDVQSSAITGSDDVYGGSGTYGGGTYYGTNTAGYANVYQAEVQPAQQECESFAIEFICYNDGNEIGKGAGFIGAIVNAGISSSRLERRQSRRISSV